MKTFSIAEFKPTILFLLKFVGIYVIGNIIYGLFITSFSPAPDPVTHQVSVQAASILRMLDYDLIVLDHQNKPTTSLVCNNKAVISIYEGCNGLNTAIVFVAFIVAFGPLNKSTAWFISVGLLIIHFTNLVRIVLLFLVSNQMPKYLYFTHKYLFTAIIYMVIFALWIIWTKFFSLKKQ
jgi:exosortase family protein XrtF